MKDWSTAGIGVSEVRGRRRHYLMETVRQTAVVIPVPVRKSLVIHLDPICPISSYTSDPGLSGS